MANCTYKRQSEILNLLVKKQRITVSELSSVLKVSSITIRKDLSSLEGRQLLRREQGYAVVDTSTPLNLRLATNYAAKRGIAIRAADLVHDGETIFIESGSCCILLADELNRRGTKAVVVTNSTFLASYVGSSPTVHVLLTGGDYQPDSMAMTGLIAKQSVLSFHAAYFFAGADGYRIHSGFTGDDMQRAELLRVMAKQSEKTIVITEAEKFKREGALTFLSPDEVDMLITDQPVTDPVIRDELLDKNVNILTASVPV